MTFCWNGRQRKFLRLTITTSTLIHVERRVCVPVYQMELSDAELKLLFGSHEDVFSEVQDRMSLGVTEVTAQFTITEYCRLIAVVLMTRFFTDVFSRMFWEGYLVQVRRGYLIPRTSPYRYRFITITCLYIRSPPATLFYLYRYRSITITCLYIRSPPATLFYLYRYGTDASFASSHWRHEYLLFLCTWYCVTSQGRSQGRARGVEWIFFTGKKLALLGT